MNTQQTTPFLSTTLLSHLDASHPDWITVRFEIGVPSRCRECLELKPLRVERITETFHRDLESAT